MGDLLAKRPGGINLLARPSSQPPYYPSVTAPAAYVEVWEHDLGESRDAARLVGRFAKGATGALPWNPASDRSKVLYAVSYSARGVASVTQLAHAPSVTVDFNRETIAPTVTQVGTASASVLTLGVDGFTNYARKRRIRVADNSGMTDASVFEFDAGAKLMPRFVDLLRDPVFQSTFAWTGNDPASNGFTKSGSATTSANGLGWRINSIGNEGATIYSKSSFPASPFTNGFTLELTPPTVASTEGDGAVMVRVDDGSKKYELLFNATQVQLNGGSWHTHGGARVRLVLPAGGAVADLWIGTTKAEDNTAYISGSLARLSFGDHVGAADADTTWFTLAYALTPQEPRLAQTVYVRVAHDSGNGYGPESTVESFSFADEFGAGGTSGTEDQFFFWRQEVTV